jgi:hypothetical protein
MADATVVWQILVEECGADPELLEDFASSWPCDEYRFVGYLGFGGKVRSHSLMGHDNVWVDYYPEDKTPERDEMVKLANKRLMEEAIYGNPDGFVLVHARASGSSTCYFGPFASREELDAWVDEHPEVRGGSVVAMYKTVDWRR